MSGLFYTNRVNFSDVSNSGGGGGWVGWFPEHPLSLYAIGQILKGAYFASLINPPPCRWNVIPQLDRGVSRANLMVNSFTPYTNIPQHMCASGVGFPDLRVVSLTRPDAKLTMSQRGGTSFW